MCNADDARRGFDEYGVDGVMIGRATFGQPWIFKDIRDALDSDDTHQPQPLTIDEKVEVLLEQLRINVERCGERAGVLHTRRHLAATPLFKGIPDFRPTRIAMLRTERADELRDMILRSRELITLNS